MTDKEKVLNYLVNHLKHQKMEEESVLFISKSFPEYIYHGNAYRANVIMTGSVYDESRNFKIGSSFALNIEGIKRFVSSNFTVSEDDEIRDIILVEANIVGFNFVRFFKENKDSIKGSTLDTFNYYQKEEEIILLENLGIVSEQSWYEYINKK